MIDLCEQTGYYAPIAPQLLELLSSSVVAGKPKPGTQKRMDLTAVLRVPAGFIHAHAYKVRPAWDHARLRCVPRLTAHLPPRSPTHPHTTHGRRAWWSC